MISKILVPHDGTEMSDKAFRFIFYFRGLVLSSMSLVIIKSAVDTRVSDDRLPL